MSAVSDRATGIGGAPADQEDPRADLIWGTIPRLVEDAADRHGTIEALVDGDTRLTYAQLAPEIDGYARGFVAAGVGAGERVALWAPNCAEWMLAALGALRAGAVLVPLNTRFKGGEAAYILRSSGASDARDGAGLPRLRLPGPARGRGRGRPAAHRRAPGRGAVRARHRFPFSEWTPSSPVARRSSRPSPRRAPPRCSPTTSPTSSSPRARQVIPRARRRRTRSRSAPSERGRPSSGCRQATATSWSTRSSTRSATRRASWRASWRAPPSCPSPCSTPSR